jgi:ABC-type polysaccharide/polyol phosphate export permease
VQPISEVFLQAFFYASPVIFPIEVVPEKWREWIMLNPFGVVIQQIRHSAIDPSVPGAFGIATWQPYAAIAIVLVLLVGGFFVFRRRAPSVAEDL